MYPLVAIIIPVYNAERHLETCIKSVISQTYTNLEIILVNDGSTDSSGEICDKYANADKRIKVVHRINQGVSAARNTGIELTTSDFIQFLDSDDFLEVNATESLINVSKNGKCDLVVGNYMLFYDHDNSIKRGFNPFESNSSMISMEQYLSKLAEYTTNVYFGSNWNKLYDATIIKKNSIRFEDNENYAEDFMFNLNYLMHIKNIGLTSNTVNNYRVESLNSISKSSRSSMKLWDRSKDIFLSFQTLYHHHGIDKKFKIDIERFLLKQIILCFRNIFNEKELLKAQRYSLINSIITDEIVCKNTNHLVAKRFLEGLTIWLIKQKSCRLLGLVYMLLHLRIKILNRDNK